MQGRIPKSSEDRIRILTQHEMEYLLRRVTDLPPPDHPKGWTATKFIRPVPFKYRWSGARCIGEDRWRFWVQGQKHQHETAQLCRGCPQLRMCERAVFTIPLMYTEYGVWAGLTASERTRLRHNQRYQQILKRRLEEPVILGDPADV